MSSLVAGLLAVVVVGPAHGQAIRLILAAQGAGPQDIVKLTFYVAARPVSLAKLNAKRAEMFAGTAPPPSTWIQVAGLARPEYLVEIEAVAAVPVRAN
jgi:enamine deaminase RidA (YjgF/YER057c/UK114 family)